MWFEVEWEHGFGKLSMICDMTALDLVLEKYHSNSVKKANGAYLNRTEARF
jgi:hypothetical protein